MDVSIIIPALNEGRNIAKVISDIKNVLNKKYSFELIVVDGNSSDNTVEVAKKLGVRVIYNCIGKGFAVREGFKNAQGKIIVIMDADCSHRASELILLIQNIKNGYDICMGSRFLDGGGTSDMSWCRRIGNNFFVFLVNTLWHAKYTDLCYGYRSFDKNIINKMNLESKGFSIETEISIKAAKLGLKVKEVPSFEKKRLHGDGKLNTISDGLTIISWIVKESLRSYAL